MKSLNEYIINEAKNLSELKDKIKNLKVDQTIDCVYCVKEKITEPHNSGQYIVDTAVTIAKYKSFPLRKEKYYLINNLFTGGDTIIEQMFKSINKNYNHGDFAQGCTLEEIYKMLDSLGEGMIKSSSTMVAGYFISEDAAIEKMKELTKPYQISSLEDKIKAIENGMKNLEQMKAELKKLKSEDKK